MRVDGLASAKMLVFFFGLCRDAVVALLFLLAVTTVAREGLSGLARRVVLTLKLLPGVELLIRIVLRREVRGFLRQIERDAGREEKKGERKTMAIPEKGLNKDELMLELRRRKEMETDPHSGKIFAYVYTSEDTKFNAMATAFDMFEFGIDPHDNEGDNTKQERDSDTEMTDQKRGFLVRMFYHAFMHENALNPMVFPSLRHFETEIVAMVAHMLHGDGGVVGNVTSGGTESILMAVKTYRDRARSLYSQITQPEMVAPLTIHPAFEKAASYFNVKMVHVLLKKDLSPDMEQYRKAITPNTILLLCSAPEYCYGMIDPVSQISQLAQDYGLPLHVDACFGGFILPWVERLGYSIPAFDFRLPGVTSMSADIHKYGLGIKGSSVIMYRNENLRRYQIFAYSEWPGGLFGSPSMAGTRPGGNIAASWAILNVTGVDGYMSMTAQLMNITDILKQGITQITGLEICGSPAMTAFSIRSCDNHVSIFAIADEMEKKGWNMERQRDSIHFSILPSHTTSDIAQQLLTSLREAVNTVKANPGLCRSGSAGVYGMVGIIPDKTVINDFIVEFFSELYTL